jgi:hypothetical protein
MSSDAFQKENKFRHKRISDLYYIVNTGFQPGEEVNTNVKKLFQQLLAGHT